MKIRCLAEAFYRVGMRPRGLALVALVLMLAPCLEHGLEATMHAPCST